MKKFYQGFISKVGIVFLMTLMFGVLSCGSAYAATTWDPSQKSGTTLSNNNLTATIGDIYSSSSGYVLADQGMTTGKKYFEVKILSASSEGLTIGATYYAPPYVYSTATGYYYQGYTYPSGAYRQAPYTSNDIIGVAIDLDSVPQTVKFYKNNLLVATENIPNYTGQVIRPFVNKYAGIVNSVRANFGATAFNYPIPDGYVSYDTVVTSDIVATSVSLNKTTDSLTVGSTDQLITTITPSNATNKNVTWTSSDLTVATVDITGKVTAVKAGTATITATTQDGSNLTATCIVTVNNPTVLATGITLNKTTDVLTVGNVDQLNASIAPSNVTSISATWTSSNPTIATVDSTGNVTALKTGTVTITATTQDGSNLSASCEVTVQVPTVVATSIALDKTTDSLIVGNNDQLTVTIVPDNATNKVATWTSSDSTVATVDSTGKVTAVKAGTATITATTQDGSDLSASCIVTVTDVATSGVVLNIEPEKNKIKKNETVTANLVIDNITNIAAEDIRIKYDAEKLQFIDFSEVDGIKLVKNNVQVGELRFIVASEGNNNIVNDKKILLKLNFKGIKAGDALVDVVKGRVSDGIEMEKDLTDAECGQATIIIEDMKDVNNSGEFTLLDLAIDARHLGEAPATLTQYNTDIVVNSAIDDADLLEIGNQMLLNPNYQF